MPPSATKITGKTTFGAEPESIEELPTGFRGLRDYLCNTDNAFAAMSSLGLPIKGQAWDVTAPNLKVVGRQARFAGGTADTGTGLGGACVVRVTYETPGLNGRLPPPVEGDKYTLVTPGVGSVPVLYDIRSDSGPPFNNPIANGRGAIKAIGTTQARVVTYPNPASINISRLMSLQREQNVNAQGVVLPPTRYGNVSLSFGPRQLRYVTFELGDNAGVLELVHTLEMAPNHDVAWVWEDEQGNAITSPIISQIYASASFAGLF